nr:type IV secretory system conjugative DNA transfer family protein [Ochrobactrum sp. LM19]
MPNGLKARLLASVCLAGTVVAGTTYMLWAFNYSLATRLILKSSQMWEAFESGQFLMPLHQVLAYPDNPAVRRLVSAASTATLAEIAALGVLTIVLVKRPWELPAPTDGARLLGIRDIYKAELLGGEPGRSVLLGTYGIGAMAQDVRTSRDGHILVVGPTRSGKGRGFLMTNLLEWQGSVIVFDMKFENYLKTGPARMMLGQKCLVFAPGTEHTHRWNPLDFVRPWPARATDLGNIAAALISVPENSDSYWAETARGLLAGILGYVTDSKTMEGRRNLRSALRMFSTGREFTDVLQAIVEDETGLDPFILDKFRQHIARDQRTRPSFESHVTTALDPFNNRLIAASMSESDFDLGELRRKPFSLFIGSPVADFRTVEPVIRLLIDQINGFLTREEPGSDEPHKVLMLLDEFYQFEKLNEIIRRTPIVASFGLSVVLITQNISQLIDVYGKPATEAFLGNMDVQLFIAVGDDASGRFLSEKLGNKYVRRVSRSRLAGGFGRATEQVSFEQKPLLSPADLQGLSDDKTVLFVRGKGAARLNKLNFYENRRFTSIRARAEGTHGTLPRPHISVPDEWPLFQPRPVAARPRIASVRKGAQP